MKRITALVLIAAAALTLGFVEAYGTGLLPIDRVFTPDERQAITEMRAATKGHPEFLGDGGFYLTDSDHSSAAGPNGEPCFDERWLYFWAQISPSPVLLTTSVRHRMPSPSAPALCYGALGDVIAREDLHLFQATSVLEIGTCYRIEGQAVISTPLCRFGAWVPVVIVPPPSPGPGLPCLQTPLGCFPQLPPSTFIEDPWAAL